MPKSKSLRQLKMKKTIVVYGSTTGVCQDIAERIASKLGGVEVISASELTADTLAANDNLLLGTSTWGEGDVQDDWYDALDTLKAANLSGKTVAIFGCGDSVSYGDSFCGGMRALYDAAKEAGANVIGEVSASQYSFDSSNAVIDGKFVGLALDENNESDKTDERIDAWLGTLTL